MLIIHVTKSACPAPMLIVAHPACLSRNPDEIPPRNWAVSKRYVILRVTVIIASSPAVPKFPLSKHVWESVNILAEVATRRHSHAECWHDTHSESSLRRCLLQNYASKYFTETLHWCTTSPNNLGHSGSEACRASVAIYRLYSRKCFQQNRRLCILNVTVDILHDTRSNSPLYLSNGCTIDYNRHLENGEISVVLDCYV